MSYLEYKYLNQVMLRVRITEELILMQIKLKVFAKTGMYSALSSPPTPLKKQQWFVYNSF